ncbi:unnamed protein product [Cryptosporidium hominis]|uniref:Uncharacterized protein n=1 Tax=Cryptosporidium hominis TaxID=237895 RepID=A0A0S4TFL6_CRYHO|nr:hypothetical protein [Cryptosporidium hominis TU502]OLQ16814.1 hypothetical protein ChTU502y2012_386g0445 [Cryptosporidium hominis]PPA63896.1 hypothetical protein ChUKH1_06565 [Cryptosporidium hominis]PPS94313.1 Uncharacterized protein GY17_00003893 [Cryptosporidium hominis]CUV06206.1 unnamed protein product [Cryptosporidium hominis]|eukprot:PPS94313.1 Uncharacterized protein GY17_00003893 [Cryptosporidium hominis]
MLSEKEKSIEYLKKIKKFRHKIDTGIIKLKSRLLNYLQEPLYDYLDDTRKEVDQLYNETRMYVYSHETPFNPRYATDDELISRYSMAKLIDIKTRKLMDKTINMLSLENERHIELMQKEGFYGY